MSQVIYTAYILQGVSVYFVFPTFLEKGKNNKQEQCYIVLPTIQLSQIHVHMIFNQHLVTDNFKSLSKDEVGNKL